MSIEIMNISTTSKGIGTAVEAALQFDNDWESRLALAYRMGHRDARHSACEISETIVSGLTQELTLRENQVDAWETRSKKAESDRAILLKTLEELMDPLLHNYACHLPIVENCPCVKCARARAETVISKMREK